LNLYRPFHRVGLINRGEPAVRFLRAARAWSARRGESLEVVAFYTEPDRDALFVQEADATVALGDALVTGEDGKRRSAYLDVPRIVQLLQEAGCDAVWPGWGFLSESPTFADALKDAGIVFIGPPASAMRKLGDKIAGKQLAETHGVPVTPWSGGPVPDAAEARRHADRIGYPVLLKAAAGGGGRGIRIVPSSEEVESLFATASSEALAAFGDGTLLVEAMMPEARHIEVQVLADSHGNVHALGTRDCSMQRRHQKMIEEAPAPNLLPALEKALLDASVAVARASGYVNAGTAEFLVRPDGGGFAFLEMNTRLQVEHPVTECVTGIDLVEAQINVARGEALEWSEIASRGHAIEVRLNAEDPDERFAPSVGRLLRFDLPHGPGIRVDTGFSADTTIPSEFDSMLAKVIATGATREQALSRLRDALARFTVAIDGGTSNRSLLLELLGHEAFRTESITTRWLDRYLTERPTGVARPLLAEALVVAAISERERSRRGDVFNFLKEAHRGAVPSNPPIPEARTYRFQTDDRAATLDVATVSPRRYRVSDGSRSVFARFEYTGRSTGLLTLFGRRHAAVIVRTSAGLIVELDGVSHRFSRASDGRLLATVPAAVTFVHVKPGDRVRAGQRLVTFEVMKMEIGQDAPFAGRVAKLHVDSGSRVAAGDPIAIIEAEEGGAQQSAIPFAPFETLPEAQSIDAWGDPLARLRGAFLGYDVPSVAVKAAEEQLRDGLSLAREELLALLELYVAREQLFDRALGPEGSTFEHFSRYLQLPRARADGLPESFLPKLKQALSGYEIKALSVGPVLESALLRIAQAHRLRDQHEDILFAILTALERDATSGEAPPRTRVLLDALAAIVTPGNPRLGDAVWTAEYVLCDRPKSTPRASGKEAISRFAAAGLAKEIDRLRNFHLEPLPSPGEVFLALATAEDSPGDERLVCFVEIERLEAGARGFDRAYLVAVHAMRECLGRLKDSAKLVWNRLVVSVRKPLPSDREVLQQIATRLATPASGLGLEKILILGQTEEKQRLAVEWSAPTGHGAAISISEADDTPIEPLSDYERRVVEARRRGLFYPYELARLLSNETEEGPLPPGRFQELDLDPSGEKLVPVQRPWGGNTANLVVGLVENRFAPFEDGLRRVLIIGDPTRGMGALSEAECRRILAAIELADAERLPIEWVPVSSGAKIAWDSGTENLDWTARVLARIVQFTQAGGVIHVIVDGVCVGAQSYWNAEATMLMHCKGALVMTPRGSMLLTGKRALEFAGSVAAEDNQGIGGFDRIMGPNGEAQYFAPDLVTAYQLLFRHYTLTHVAPNESKPRLLSTSDPSDRDVTQAPYFGATDGFQTIGEIFDEATNPGRKRPFAIRPLMRAVLDQDVAPLERWMFWQGAESSVVWEASLGGQPISCIGIESKPVKRRGDLPADGPDQWTAGTLFPLSSKKVARALMTASGVKPVVVLANLSGFDGSPESLRNLQLEYGAEIGRAVVNFKGPLIFCVVSRYHGGAYVVFSRALNPQLDALALSGSYASVIGGAPAAAVVFPGLVKQRAAADAGLKAARRNLDHGTLSERAAAQAKYEQVLREATSRAQAQVAREFDAVHTVERAQAVGSIEALLQPSDLRAELIRRIRG
jgi:acetyl/propionyl-CoA carboxylase alpha subunit/acetyl-CoA carboxylase carboxyltransferase component